MSALVVTAVVLGAFILPALALVIRVEARERAGHAAETFSLPGPVQDPPLVEASPSAEGKG